MIQGCIDMDKINEMRLRFLSKSSNESFAIVNIADLA